MGNRIVIYQKKLEDNLKESYKHLERLESAFDELSNSFEFPLDKNSFEKITSSRQLLAYSDQIIYRFSKLQDCMGAKLFKSLLLFQGENVNKPFLDILNQLEKIEIINVDEWFEIRDLRNEIAHYYEDNELESITILNTIYKLRNELKNILNTIKKIKEEAI
jgi:uncharacterized protein with HEPN domain